MAEEVELTQKREELKRQLAAGEYKTLIDVILDGTGRFIQKLTRNPKPPSFWYSAVVIVLVSSLISSFISLLLGENHETMPHFFELEGFLLAISTVGLGLIFMIVSIIYIRIFRAASRDYLLDAIESVTDLTDFQHWLAAFGNVRKALFFSLAFGILFGFASSVFTSIHKGGFVGFGPTILFMIIDIPIGMATYYLLLLLNFTARLSRYQFKLYAADPSNSEIIDHLSDLLTNGVYMGAILGTICTLFFVSFGILTIETMAGLVLFAWGPLTVFFVLSQIALRKIITKAKWKKLNEVQMKIETLETQEDIPSEKTLEHLGKLMDYHDRIKVTRNSALDLRAGLNFLNSLLIPLLAFILANLDKVLDFFS